MRIDAHQHYWQLSRGDYGWITPERRAIFRDFGPAQLLPHLRRHRLDGSIVVHAAWSIAETDYLLSLAAAEDTILGVVGWLDPGDPQHRSHFARFRRHPKFVGFRLVIHGPQDAEQVLQPHVIAALRGYAGEGVPIDLLVTSDQLAALLELLRRVPDLRGVIDHLAKPRIRDGELEPWRSRMREIAAFPHLWCKLSGMVTEADPCGWKLADFVPYVQAVIAAFGAKRVMFGSDWPMCLEAAAGYDEVVEVLEQALPEGWTEQEREWLYGGNAQEFYRL